MKINAILEILQSCHKDHKTNQQLYCLYVCCLYELWCAILALFSFSLNQHWNKETASGADKEE